MEGRGECKDQQKLCGAGMEQVPETLCGSPAESQHSLRGEGWELREGLGPPGGVQTPAPRADAAGVGAG